APSVDWRFCEELVRNCACGGWPSSSQKPIHLTKVERVVLKALHTPPCRLTVQAVSIRIAMWSGPRNISTAMMRAWGNRYDTVVVDEPFYAYYLRATGKAHPGAGEVIATGETDLRKVVAHLTGPIANGKRIFFQKQMTHHLLPEIDREWLGVVTNCFL